MSETTVEIYMKSGNVLRLPLKDMWWYSEGGQVTNIKWLNGDESPSLNFIKPGEIEAIVCVSDPPMAGKVFDEDGNFMIDLDSEEKK